MALLLIQAVLCTWPPTPSLVRKIDATTGAVTTLGASASPAFVGVALDSSLIYVGDFTTNLGTSASPAFSGPFFVAVDSSGNVFVGDFNANLVRKIYGLGARRPALSSSSRSSASP